MHLKLYKFTLRLIGVEETPNLAKVLNNAGWMLLGSGWRMLLGLGIMGAVARYLGPTRYGLLNYSMAIVALFNFVASLGLNEILVRQIVKDKQKHQQVLVSAFILRILGGIAAFCLSLGLAFLLHPQDILVFWIVGILSLGLVVSSFDVIDSYFQSQMQAKYTVLAKTGAFTVCCAVRIILITVQAPLIAFVWVVFVETILGATTLVFIYYKCGFLLNLKTWNKEISRYLLSNGWPIFLTGMLSTMYMRIDQVMIGHWRGPQEVGFYAAAVSISELWGSLGSVLSFQHTRFLLSLRKKIMIYIVKN